MVVIGMIVLLIMNFVVTELFFANRAPSPKAQEVKQLYANVKLAITPKSITVKNENLF
uniref:CAZy families GH2 protein n=1 Tax=uncultured Bifidobacterium sp. TaxID=165187 RepID=A0A060CS96_9BIFI|nr:CAZy families GH2 protein [uncultured Bifidobacterium sp.]